MEYFFATNRKSLLFAISLFALMGMTVQAQAPLEVEYLDGQKVFIKNPAWHKKDDGAWLFTCRLEALAQRFVKPVAHLHLYHKVVTEEEGEEEITWEQTSIVRRDTFDRNYGTRKATFARVFVKDLPKDLESITVEFKNEPPQNEE